MDLNDGREGADLLTGGAAHFVVASHPVANDRDWAVARRRGWRFRGRGHRRGRGYFRQIGTAVENVNAVHPVGA